MGVMSLWAAPPFRIGVSSLLATGVTLVSVAAVADSTPGPSDKCAATLTCSSGSGQLRATGRGPLITSVNTGWMPACTGGVDHCSDNPLQVRADISLNAPDDPTKFLFDVDMTKGAVVDVTWPTTDSLTLKLASATQKNGTFTIKHTLVPNVSLYVGLILNQEFNFDASVLISHAPGGHWNYLGQGVGAFSPWSLDGSAESDVKGPALQDAELLSTKIEDLPGMAGILAGTLALSATTSPTFFYKTTKVQFTGATTAITPDAPNAKIKVQNVDFVDLVADVQGEITYKGTMEVLPNVTVTQVLTLTGLNLNIPISVGAKTDYDDGGKPLAVQFPKTTIHIPLPNIAVPTDAVDFGQIKTGSTADKTTTIVNNGELGGILSLESSDPQFTIETPKMQMGAKAKQDVVLHFTPAQDGDASATITVRSNDPDSPVQTFQVKGSAKAAAAPPAPQAPAGDPPPVPKAEPGANSGCGCHTTTSSAPRAAGTALVALAALAFVRRRRRAGK